MSDLTDRPRLADRWGQGPASGTDPLDAVVYLSHLIGAEARLVQPGGGNTSVKVPAGDGAGPTLLVKGSGTDLSTVGRTGFARLSLERLGTLAQAETMSDPDMMRFMAACALSDGPPPSVETPLHALLPHAVIAHTHDVATMSLTNLDDAAAERLVGEVFGGRIVYAPYARPGFPLAQSVARLVGTVPPDAIGMTLAHHGLVVWADDARECYARLVALVGQIEEYLATARQGKRLLGALRAVVPSAEVRRKAATAVLPAVRGALGGGNRVIVGFDDGDDVLTALGAERTREVVARGMATPEHVLRAGRLPVWLDLDLTAPADRLVEAVRAGIARAHEEYRAYHEAQAPEGREPIADWAKVVLVPGLGLITGFADAKGARTANLCYRAGFEAMINAEALGGFRFLSDAQVFEFEHWPLERRKVEEQLARERATRLLPRQIALVIGGGSGIGRAAAWRFAEEGAHVVVADLDGAVAERAAREIGGSFPGRVVGLGADARDEASLDALFERVVLEFGGLDCLFYTPGLPPRFAGITEVTRDDLQRQLDVNYLGAVAAIGRAAIIMRRQGTGGAIVGSVSKAALTPGPNAVAYGASKAAMLQALRVAAVELGPDGIRVNAINADQVDTPLFRKFVEERAAARGVTVEEQLARYRARNVMGASLIPPEAVADLAVLLASDRFRYTTGDILTVDGGLPDAFPR